MDPSLIPTFPLGFVNPFLSGEPEGSIETAQVTEAIPIRMPSRILRGQTVVTPESHHAAALDDPVVKTPFYFLGI
jgi:hypothetical protein